MALLISYSGKDPKPWVKAFETALPDVEARVYPNVGNPEEIEYAAVWQHPHGDLSKYPNLKAILSFGSGVEHIVSDPDLPAGVPVVRLVDDAVVHDMGMHILHWVLHFHRGYQRYHKQQLERLWQPLQAVAVHQRRIGIMGMGAIGQHTSALLHHMRFSVTGWGIDPCVLAQGIGYRCGENELEGFLRETDILINSLPLTPHTQNMIGAKELDLLPDGAFVISASRGGIINEQALLAALDSGRVRGAALDVFAHEPLPQNSRLWTHPSAIVTPHIGGINYPESAVRVMAENIQKIISGELPSPVYDAGKGY
ncbi:glyoxylate/hydroxypyruvate reductase A [Pseudomonas sp. CDFA 553]|uniref:2-hydroxyacid dehydrogenase n=1 Tax=Pseudomonas quasicaspiana TaxID=2829821 RepID=UPI001E5FC97F|nr:glyoxylate/hydroxypyruvate reductase A [Pseudomonas quasicaspiana]MCD5987206.1 glyoxylate/hydroxypyruvate reductase A [Pseudomonas quasicaspiana]